MSIDPRTEEVLSLTDAVRLFPRRRGGKLAHVATLYRYSTTGVRGVILETLQCGATRCTSREAIERFFDQLTARSGAGSPKAPARKSPSKKKAKQITAARKKLARAGVR